MFDIIYSSEGCSYASTPTYLVILAVLICLGGILSYLPQYYSLIRSRSVEGISEFSFLILNVSSACLSMNSLILNWWRFECYEECNFWLCTGNLLSTVQIFIAWIVVLPLYLIFVRYKIIESDRKILYDILYIFIYLIFILLMVIVGLTERLISPNNDHFFIISAEVLGILSAIGSCVVWIPQIISLVHFKEAGSLSLLMFALQTPGNVIVITLQVLYDQDWTTWLPYAVTLVEQIIILVILIIYKIRDNRARYNLVTDVTLDNEILI